MTIPKQFIEEAKARGEERCWDAWFALGDEALLRLVAVARSREDGAVTLPDSQVIAEEMFGRYGEETVTSMMMHTLTYGIGKQLWDMKFFTEDGTPIDDDTAWDEVRRHLREAAEDEPWEFGRNTIIRWVLRDPGEAKKEPDKHSIQDAFVRIVNSEETP